MRLDDNNAVSLVAGDKTEPGTCGGIGAEARFQYPTGLESDGHGCLFVIDSDVDVRKVALTDHTVTTPRQICPTVRAIDLGYDSTNERLLVATRRTLHYVKPDGSSEALALQWDPSEGRDGPAAGTPCTFFTGLVTSPDGLSAYLIDRGTLLKADLRTGLVTTLTRSASQYLTSPALLLDGSGLVAVGMTDRPVLFVFKSDEFKCHGTASAAAAAAASASTSKPVRRGAPPLSARLLMLPDSGPATVNVRVGSPSDCRVFTVHRSVLAQRSGYFRGLLEGGFREGSAAEVELPEADPDAFAMLLEYMYTGALNGEAFDDSDADKGRLLRATVELAGLLLLEGGAPSQLQRRLLAAVTPASLLADLVWAERHGLADVALMLRAWVWADYWRVLRATPQETLCQLMADSPLVMESCCRAN